MTSATTTLVPDLVHICPRGTSLQMAENDGDRRYRTDSGNAAIYVHV